MNQTVERQFITLHLPLGLVVSVLLHVVFCIVLCIYFKIADYSGFNRLKEAPRMIDLERVDENFLNKLRTVGVKGGAKDFSMPHPSQAISLPGRAGGKKISAKDLSFNMNDTDIKAMKPQKSDPTVIDPNAVSIRRAKAERVQQKRITQERNLNNMLKREMLAESIPYHEQDLIRYTDINMHFEVPEGVEESELNSIEKKFYSFRKRSYELYVNSFLQTYREAIQEKPYLHQVFNSSKDYMVGKLTLDADGNIVSLKMVQPAKNLEIQKVFEKTMENIKQLKNPPEEFVKSGEGFSVYYALRINN